MYETYRVRRRFQWNGWIFGPNKCVQDCEGRCGETCNRIPGGDCRCGCGKGSVKCSCAVRPEQWGGDIWIVAAGDARKEHILARRFAVYDATIPDADKLIEDEGYLQLLEPPRALQAA